MVEVDGDGGGFALVPGGLGDGEVEEDHAVSGFSDVDLGFAEEEWGGLLVGEGFELGEAGVEVGDVGFFYGAGGDGVGVGGGEGGGEVLDEERQVAAVFDVQVDEEVEGVLDSIAADDEGF